MRKLRFRAWDKAYKVFHYMEITKKGMASDINPNGPVGELENWEQSTGHEDGKDTEIYEGDIVQDGWNEDGHGNVEVLWRNHGLWFMDPDGNLFQHDDIKPVRIIGNTHEHPELLEE